MEKKCIGNRGVNWERLRGGGVIMLLSLWPFTGLWMTSHYTLSCVHLLSLSTHCHKELDFTHATHIFLSLSFIFSLFFCTLKRGYKSSLALCSPSPIGKKKKKNGPDLTLSHRAQTLICPAVSLAFMLRVEKWLDTDAQLNYMGEHER